MKSYSLGFAERLNGSAIQLHSEHPAAHFDFTFPYQPFLLSSFRIPLRSDS
jgi:hypothetical protein